MGCGAIDPCQDHEKVVCARYQGDVLDEPLPLPVTAMEIHPLLITVMDLS